MNALIEIHHLVKNYRTGPETLRIIRGTSFKVERGVSVSITGASGSGKSTLLNILGGLDHFDAGSCVVAGRNLGELSEKMLAAYRRSTVGFVFQFHYLLNDFTALENVMLPAYIAGEKKKTATERARGLLCEMQLDDRMQHYPAQLSGGERQRVAVARSLINNPDIILADEPTGNLDDEHSSLVASLLYQSAAQHGKTLLIVTHNETIARKAEFHWSLVDGLIRDRNVTLS